MHIIHIVRDLDIASGGPSRSVPALAEHQARHSNIQVTVQFQDRGNPLVHMANSAVKYEAMTGRGQGRDPKAKSGNGLFFHLHGLWSLDLHRAAKLARSKRIPYVVSTRGMLANWALGHKALKKKIAWKLYQQRDLENAACLLASTEFEQQDVEALLAGSRVVAIPNGCVARPVNSAVADILPDFAGSRWALAMGRLHPVKGYAELIKAWAGVDPAGWKLAIAGPDEAGYRSTLEALITKHGLGDSVFLTGEVDDNQKWALFDQCELFVAPSRTENFGMAIAEALQSGTPVITTKGTPWLELVEHECGWWVDNDPQALEQALREATTSSASELVDMGANGKALIQDKYTWDQVADRTIELYRSII
ncbi:glycosyltransferase [Pseudomonadota bacterium]